MTRENYSGLLTGLQNSLELFSNLSRRTVLLTHSYRTLTIRTPASRIALQSAE
jgi:hypothetical protein